MEFAEIAARKHVDRPSPTRRVPRRIPLRFSRYVELEENVNDYPSYETLVGTPEEVIEGGQWPDLPLRTLWAECLDCSAYTPAGRYWYENERVLLHDNSHYTAEDWNAEAHRIKPPTRKFWCSPCEALTFHVARDEKVIRGILMKRGLNENG